MAAPSQPVLPSIFSLCDLSALDDDPAWLPLEGTLSSVSCLGFAADSMFASDLDPLSGFVAESEPLGDQPLPPRLAGHNMADPLPTRTSAEAAAFETHHFEGGELRAALLQSAASTPASSCATVAPAADAVVKDEPPATAGGAAMGVGATSYVRPDPDSDGGKSTRTSTLKVSAGSVLTPGHTLAPPPRAAALVASAAVAKMAAAETAAALGGAAAGGGRTVSGTSGASTEGGSSLCHSGLPASAAAALSGESKETSARKPPAPGCTASKKVTGSKRAAPPAGPGSSAGSEADGVAAKPPTRRRMASRFDAQIDPNLSAEERRRARRMLSNRESARRSRHRKETFLQSVSDQLVEMEALKAAASRAAAEAAAKLASLQRNYDEVMTERDALRLEVAILRAQACAATVL